MRWDKNWIFSNTCKTTSCGSFSSLEHISSCSLPSSVQKTRETFSKACRQLPPAARSRMPGSTQLPFLSLTLCQSSSCSLFSSSCFSSPSPTFPHACPDGRNSGQVNPARHKSLPGWERSKEKRRKPLTQVPPQKLCQGQGISGPTVLPHIWQPPGHPVCSPSSLRATKAASDPNRGQRSCSGYDDEKAIPGWKKQSQGEQIIPCMRGFVATLESVFLIHLSHSISFK